MVFCYGIDFHHIFGEAASFYSQLTSTHLTRPPTLRFANNNNFPFITVIHRVTFVVLTLFVWETKLKALPVFFFHLNVCIGEILCVWDNSTALFVLNWSHKLFYRSNVVVWVRRVFLMRAYNSLEVLIFPVKLSKLFVILFLTVDGA